MRCESGHHALVASVAPRGLSALVPIDAPRGRRRSVVRPRCMTTEDFIAWRNLALVPCIVAVLVFLAVVLCREWVKSDLREKMCEPIRIRWRPFAWRTNRLTCAFKVMYSDFEGRVHRGTCWTYWHRRSVTWDGDEIISPTHETVA